jgi:hypothetical protein
MGKYRPALQRYFLRSIQQSETNLASPELVVALEELCAALKDKSIAITGRKPVLTIRDLD